MVPNLTPPGHDELVEVGEAGGVGDVAGRHVGLADVDTVQYLLCRGRHRRGCHLSDKKGIS